MRCIYSRQPGCCVISRHLWWRQSCSKTLADLNNMIKPSVPQDFISLRHHESFTHVWFHYLPFSQLKYLKTVPHNIIPDLCPWKLSRFFLPHNDIIHITYLFMLNDFAYDRTSIPSTCKKFFSSLKASKPTPEPSQPPIHWWSGKVMKISTHLHLVPAWRISAAIP